ncbi:MAG TPA: glucose-6-phosphate isomerase, partial [Gemmataceae bacterium]|nr:glucose-6-phosphate isomerase [Gemmataceae bacterium]
LPDEAIVYNYQGLLAPAGEEWTPAAELRAQHFLQPARLKDLSQRLMQVRGQVATERDMRDPPPDMRPLESGFIDLPQALLDGYRRKGDASDLGRALTLAARLRDEADRVVLLGVGGSQRAARALFQALKSTYHNELPSETRLGVPRVYFDGDGFDNDALQELLDLLQITCVDPEQREERWAVVCLSKTGATLEPNVALRVFRREATEYYGLRSEWLRRLFAAATGSTSKLRKLFVAEGHADGDVLTIPDNVGGRFSAFTAAGLLPAAVMGLDVRALLLGASAMTKRFLEEPFERNPVLQFAGVNYLISEELHKPLRMMSVWSKKLEGLGQWYDHLLAESLGKQGRGPTPLTTVQTRDLPARGQQQQDGPRDRVINNLVIRNAKGTPILVQMADHNDDDLNAFARKGLPDLLSAAHRGANQAYFDAARPTADLVLPVLSEHTLGQMMQMLMLATVVEARLMGVNPYSQPGAEPYKRNMLSQLRS